MRGHQCFLIDAALTTGYVAIIGKPNAGKSTLLNSLLGQKLSAVTRKAQTTRHRILGIESGDNYQMILLDTPGVIKVSQM
jgi:GTP-binding protein Era